MTRKEAKKEFWKKDGVFEKMFKYCLDRVLKLPYKGSVVDAFIDKIYDNYENKICENCKYHYPYDEDAQYIDSYDDKYCSRIGINTPDYFGCNRFERKNDEQNNQENN